MLVIPAEQKSTALEAILTVQSQTIIGAIQLKPELAELYNNRAIAYVNKGDLERAILDYSEAIELQAHFSAAYFNRGVAHLRLKEWIKAKVDMTNASKMGVNIVTAFRIDYANVEDFEKRTGTKLPPDIAAMACATADVIDDRPTCPVDDKKTAAMKTQYPFLRNEPKRTQI